MSNSRLFSLHKTSWTWVALFVCLAVTFGFDATPSALHWPLRVLWFGSLLLMIAALVSAVKGARLDRRKVIFILVIAGFWLLMLEAVCWIFVSLMAKRDDRLAARGVTTLSADCREQLKAVFDTKPHYLYDPVIGWVSRPGFKDKLCTVNAQGIRTLHDYPQAAPDDSKRVLCMGDSFTYGVAVGDKETYPAQAEQLWPGTEWLNFGIAGTCLTQAYLHYHEHAKKFGGRYVVIGFMTNDAQRTVNCFRPLLNHDTGFPMTKPFAKYVDGRFSIEPNPYLSLDGYRALLADEKTELRKLLQLDYLTWCRQSVTSGPIRRTFGYVADTMNVEHNLEGILGNGGKMNRFLRQMLPQDPYGEEIWSPGSPGFKAICSLFDLFHDEVVKDGRIPLIVIIPGPRDIEVYRKHGPRQYATLVDHLKSKQDLFLDFLDPMVSKHPGHLANEELFVQQHYQPYLNKDLAEEIIKKLKLP